MIGFMDANECYDESLYLFESFIAHHMCPRHGFEEQCESTGQDTMFVDLHGYSAPVAKRAALGILRGMPAINLVLISGCGKNSIKSSKKRLDPVLKPFVREWLSKSEPRLTAAELVSK